MYRFIISCISILYAISLSAQTISGTIDGHDYVDLGLPSGTLWATCNIGASSPEQYGDYYAWGETETKSLYWEKNSKWFGVESSILKQKGVIDSNGILTSDYDVASVKWGNKWRMPTVDEIKELKEKKESCGKRTINGINGLKIFGKNGESLFIPYGGHFSNEKIPVKDFLLMRKECFG